MDKQRRIFGCFCHHEELRFSDIERLTALRSNDLSYHLKQLQARGLLEKREDAYALTAEGEQELPFHTPAGERSPLPVLLVRVEHAGKVLVHRREKRPFQGLWSLPGGRIRFGESIAEAAGRIARKTAGADAEVTGLVGSANERVGPGTAHHFLLLCVSATLAGDVRETDTRRWFAAADLPEETIPSDRAFIQGIAPALQEFSHDVR